MRLTSLFVGSCLLLGLSACVVSSTDPTGGGVVGDGTLVVDWTINGSTDPNLCNQSSADTLQIIVVPDVGDPMTFSQDCEAFATSIDLAPGHYSASALFVDSNKKARTTTVDIDPFTIRGDDELHTPIDFPSSSFF